MVACTGNTGCRFSATDTKRHALDLVRRLEAKVTLDTPVNIHLTGCPHSCAQHLIADIGLLGAQVPSGDASIEGYHVLVGGGVEHERGLGRELAKNVAAADVAPLVEQAAQLVSCGTARGRGLRRVRAPSRGRCAARPCRCRRRTLSALVAPRRRTAGRRRCCRRTRRSRRRSAPGSTASSLRCCRRSRPRRPRRRAAAAPATALHILYASQTGTAEGLAKKLAKEAKGKGFDARAQDLGRLSPAALAALGHAVVIASTHGEGDPPDSVGAFVAALDDAPAGALAGLSYAVLALGDRNYAKFCGFGRALDERLEALGASRLAARVEADTDVAEPFARFRAALWPSCPTLAARIRPRSPPHATPDCATRRSTANPKTMPTLAGTASDRFRRSCAASTS